jgi:hypothetical protein
LRDHLLQVRKVTGRSPKGLIGPPFPDRYAPIWETFLSLHSGRSYSMGGPNPLSWSDIKAWDDLMRAGLKEWEVRAIKALDMIWLQSVGEGESNE